jgi:hypothetical protein
MGCGNYMGAFGVLVLEIGDQASAKTMRHCHCHVKTTALAVQRRSKMASRGAGNGGHCPGI